MNRGDIWYIDPGGKSGKRPVVIITRQNVIEHLNNVAVVEITAKGKGYPTEVFIDHKGNLPISSFVQTDNIHTVPKNRLVKYIGRLDMPHRAIRGIQIAFLQWSHIQHCLQEGKVAVHKILMHEIMIRQFVYFPCRKVFNAFCKQ